jgi:hypothetical protein
LLHKEKPLEDACFSGAIGAEKTGERREFYAWKFSRGFEIPQAELCNHERKNSRVQLFEFYPRFAHP